MKPLADGEASAAVGAGPEVAAGEGMPPAEGEREGRRRRRRGGRGGRDRDETSAEGAGEGGEGTAELEPRGTAQAAPAEGIETAAGPEAVSRTVEEGGEREGGRRRNRDRFRRERRAEGDEAPGVAPAEAAGEPETAPLGEGIAESAPTTSAAPSTAMAPAPEAPAVQAVVVEPYVLPIDDLQRLAEASGLQWVNSDAEKITAAQAAIAAEPRPVHVPRERKPVVIVDEGPLVLVETRKDLSQMKLPFEQAAPGTGTAA